MKSKIIALFILIFTIGIFPAHAVKPVMGVAEFHNTSAAVWWRRLGIIRNVNQRVSEL